MNCYLCGNGPLPSVGSARDHFVTREEFRLVGCNTCDIAYTDFTITEEGFAKYYGGKDYYAHADEFAQLGARERVQRDAIRLRGGERLPMLRRLQVRTLSALMLVSLPATAGSRVLDIGCGAGRMLRGAREAGCECCGVEPSSDARKLLEQTGITAFPTVFDQNLPEDYFDVVVFNQSLEHVPDPVAAVGRAYNLLRPGGQLIIGVPNYASVESRVFGPYWRHLDVPRHLNHFSPKSLAILGRRFGLKLIDERFKFWGVPKSSITLMKQQIGPRAYGKIITYFLFQALAMLSGRKRSFGSMMSCTFEKPAARADSALL